MALLQPLEAGHARADDLERLQEAVELEAVSHLDRHQREVHLDLGAVLAPRGRLQVARRWAGIGPGMASVSSSPRPTMALAGQPNTVLGRAGSSV